MRHYTNHDAENFFKSVRQATRDNQQKAWDKLIEHAVSGKKQKSFNVSLDIQVSGETWHAYGAEVSDRDILLFCDKGTATYLVDSYGDKHTTELFDWSKDDE